MAKSKVNKKVILQSIAAMICLIMAFLVNWLFIIPAVILMFLNQKELFGKKV